MDLRLADQSYEEGADGSAEIVCLNMFPIAKPDTDGRGFELRSGPGLEKFCDVGGVVRGLIATDGLFNGDIFVVAGDKLKRVNSDGDVSEVGDLPVSGQVTMAATRTELAICVAPYLYVFDGTTLTQVTDPDLPDVYSVAYLNQRFILSDENDRIYWTDLLDGSSIDGLNFLTAESHPDKLVRVFTDGESIYACGDVSTELIGAVTNPSSASAAFARLGSGVLKSGLIGLHAIAVDIDSKTTAFVGHNRVIYISNGYQLRPISTPFINRLLADASLSDLQSIRCFTFTEEGETFFVVSIPNNATFAFVKSLQKWVQLQTHEQNTWRVNQHVYAFGTDYGASDGDTKLWRISPLIRTDAGEPIEQSFSAVAPVRGNNAVADITIDGFADRDCLISMRKRKPGRPREWGSYVDRAMQSPDEDCKALWRRLGKTFPPEEVFQFRVTDEAYLTITGVRANDGFVR